MNLTLKDRLIIFNVMPKEGNMTTMSIVKDIKEKVSIKQPEIIEYEINDSENGIFWNEKGVVATFDYSFSTVELTEIKAAFKKLDTSEKINLEILETALKFN